MKWDPDFQVLGIVFTLICSFILLDCGQKKCKQGYSGKKCRACATGFQDKDENGTCEPDCQTAGKNCNQRGNCHDESGVPICYCDLGYDGKNCTKCDTNYQDNDENNTCLPTCKTANLECLGQTICDDSGGEAQCICQEGYDGPDCVDCALDYQDNDVDGTCYPACSHPELACGANGLCDDSSGQLLCLCATGYAGERCEVCDHGYQDNDDNDSCEIGCLLAALSCSKHGLCDDSSGTPQCECLEGYIGEDCIECDTGYQDKDGNDSCHPTCSKANLACVEGDCSDESGIAICVCKEAYTGKLCDKCGAGYQDNAPDELCRPNCANATDVNCTGHFHCEDTTGFPTCICDGEYIGENCDSCASGFQDNDLDGSCLPTCAMVAYDCSNIGICDDASGIADCLCPENYQHDGEGLCVEPNGFTCYLALELDLGATTVSGNTDGAGDNSSCSCVNNTSDEVVYVFEVVESVHVKFSTSGFDTVIYLRSDCEDDASQLICDDDSSGGSGSTIEADLKPGEYYLFIDGYGSSYGHYILSIDVVCPTGQIFYSETGLCINDPCQDPNPCQVPHKMACVPQLPDNYICQCDPGYIDDSNNPGTCIVDPNPHGEACADAILLDSLGGTISDSTLDALDNAQGSCGGKGSDRVYTFTLEEPVRAEFAVSGYDTVMYLRRDCNDPGSQIACNDDGVPGSGSLIVSILDAGSYSLWIDSYSNGGDYTLTYSFRTDPCSDDPCPGLPECIASTDWTTYQCVCPAGTVPFGNDCIDDPCKPDNPCTDLYKNRCIHDLPDYICECNIGYIPDPGTSSNCMPDPNAAEWTFMVYLNADNNLEDSGYKDLAEMSVIGSTENVNIIVLLDSYARDNGHARKLYVTQGGFNVIENMGEIDMSDWRTLRDFGIWAVQNYPARRFALVAWNHGGGWKAKIEKSPPFKGFSNDDHGAAGELLISNGDYARALNGIVDAIGDKLDLIGHDECLMGMWEVAEASAPFGHYFVASEDTEPFSGWKYDDFLGTLIKNPSMTALDLGIEIVKTYYAADTDNTTLAVSHLDTIEDLALYVTHFADTLMDNRDIYEQIDSARSESEAFGGWFGGGDFRDLKDFASRVAAISSASQRLTDAANNLAEQLDITIKYSRSQAVYPKATGLSIYFPPMGSYFDSAYTDDGAIWSQHTTWDEFLDDFTN